MKASLTSLSVTQSKEALDYAVLSEASILAVRRRLLKWGRANHKDFPWRTPTYLWHALVAEVLLQRTRAQNVVPVYQDFLTRYPEASDLKDCNLEELERIIYPLGLRWRAPLLKKLCDYLAEMNGTIPCTLEGLLELPGVGPYVAGAMLSFHCGERGLIIDANVVRWLCRMVGRPMNGETRRDKWMIRLVDSVTPGHKVGQFNYAVLDFTMEICGKRPHCPVCPLGPKLCVYGRQMLSSDSSCADPAFTISR